MIKYKLTCKDCKILFDSWFSSSKEFDKLKKRKILNCHNCKSTKIEKTLMAPQLINNFKDGPLKPKNTRSKEIDNKIREYQKFIRNNFNYVGKNFAYEARSIHYENKKSDKGIIGSASNDEIKELREEGIETRVIPWIENKDN